MPQEANNLDVMRPASRTAALERQHGTDIGANGWNHAHVEQSAWWTCRTGPDLSEKGLGDIVNWWVSTGQNLPIGAEQIQRVLGSEQIQQFASKVGLSPDLASSKLAELLPSRR